MATLKTQQFSEKAHVLVVDDDRRIRELVSRYLREHGFLVVTAQDGAEARARLEHFEFDALVVDVMMPGESGLALTQAVREKGGGPPVLLLTALGEADDRIAGLESGADDYLPKPFEPRELVLRLNAILRRTRRAEKTMEPMTIGPWLFDPEGGTISAEGESIRLTDMEVNLLSALAARPGEIMSREGLAESCGMEAGERTIDVQVTRLRRKIGDDGRAPRYLQTVRGKGYVLRTRGA